MPINQNSNSDHLRGWTLRLFAGVAGAVLLTGAAHAQSAAPATPDQAAAGGVGVVTVTAEKRSENLQKVPISATVRSGADLKAEGVYGIQALQNQTPGLSIQPPDTSDTFINIRGVGLQVIAPVSSNGVAFYVDGMYVPSLIDTVDSFYDLSSVEVLRGPQGTLVGSDADGGAIFVNTVQPSFDRVKGYIQQTIGSYSDYRTEGGINLPINDMVAARLGFVYETRDSFTKNLGAQGETGGATYPPAQNQPGNVDFEAARLQVAFKPSDNFELTFRFEPYESRNDGFALKPVESTTSSPGPYYDAYAATVIENKPYVIDYDAQQFFNIEGLRAGATAVWHITPGIEAKSITSYMAGYESDLDDLDYGSGHLGAFTPPDGSLWQIRKASFASYTQEFDLLSTGPGPFQWVAGFFYLNFHTPFENEFDFGPLFPIQVDPTHVNYAVFASGTYQFSPKWSLTAGARYSYDDSTFIEGPGCFCNFGGTPVTYATTDAEPTGAVKLNFQATPSTLLYASFTTGYKAGGINLEVANTGPFSGPPPLAGQPGYAPPFKPEYNMVEEFGVKADVFDHHVRIDADVFDSQYTGYQLEEALANGSPYIQGNDNASIWGAEAEFTGKFNDLQFNLGVSYLNATSNAFGYADKFGATLPIRGGTTLPYAPQWMLTAGIQYSFHVWGGLLTPRLQYQYQDVQYISILNPTAGPAGGPTENFIASTSPVTAIPAHGTFDFFLTYAAPEHWQIQGYVTNFTNAANIADVVNGNFGGPQGVAYGPPLQYGLRLSYNF